MTAVVVALSAAVGLLTVLVVGLLRSHAEILKALHELGAGLELDAGQASERAAVPVTVEGVRTPRRTDPTDTPRTVDGASLSGERVSLPLVGSGNTLLAFLSSGCTTCQEFWKTYSRNGVGDLPGEARLVVVTRDEDQESVSALRDRATPAVPVVMSSLTWDGFAVPGSPYFLYVDDAGQVLGEGSGATWSQVVDLLAQARADAASRQASSVRGGGTTRQDRDDRVLAAAGILPGDPSLRIEPPDHDTFDPDTFDPDSLDPGTFDHEPFLPESTARSVP